MMGIAEFIVAILVFISLALYVASCIYWYASGELDYIQDKAVDMLVYSIMFAGGALLVLIAFKYVDSFFV